MLTTPTIDDFRKQFPCPVSIYNRMRRSDERGCPCIIYPDSIIDLLNGWISPDGKFFPCLYGEHYSWADSNMKYWEEFLYEEIPSYQKIVTFDDEYNKIPPYRTYQEANEVFNIKYGQDMEYEDYLISQKWIKFQTRNNFHKIVAMEGNLVLRHWDRINWLTVHTKMKYTIDLVANIL